MPANKSTTTSSEQSNEAMRSFSVMFPQLNMHLVMSYEYLVAIHDMLLLFHYLSHTHIHDTARVSTYLMSLLQMHTIGSLP